MKTTRAFARPIIGLAASLLLALSLSACSNEEDTEATDDSSSSSSASDHNDADVAFASDMIPHHAQALAMVDLTVDRPMDPEFRDLTEQIRDAQAPEIEMMTDWLTQWGEEVPETMRDHANSGHDMSDMSEDMGDMMDMPGMMSAEDMAALADAPDAEFEDMWLEMMIEHHEGAIEMAETEQQEGKYPDATELAGEIIAGQSAEIETMQGMLDS